MMEMNRTASDRRLVAGLLFLALGTITAGVFLWLEVQDGGFRHLRQYGLEFLHRLPEGEVAFYVRCLALLLPAGLLWGLGLAFLAGRRAFERLLDRVDAIPERTFITVILAAGAVFVLLIGLFVLRNQPITDDERVYLFQAELLARGRLYVESQPLQEFYDNVFVINNGKWYGKYPPGHPLVLIPGNAVGFPRVMSMILAALNLFLFYRLARDFLSRRAARGATLLLLGSPFFLFTGATLLSHTTCLAALQTMGLATRRALRSGGTGWSLLAGAGGGFAFLTRPFTAILIGIPVALAWTWSVVRKRASWRPWLTAAGVALVFLLLFLGCNTVLTGNPLRTGYSEVQGDRSQVLGFGQVSPGYLTHTPLNGLLNLGLIAVRLNFWTWGWPLSWLFVIAALLWARQSQFRILWAILGGVAVGSLFYFSIGIGETGPVKYYEILPALALLTVAGFSAFDERLAREGRPGLSALAPGLLLAFTVLGWGFFARIQAADLRQVTARIAEPWDLVKNLEEPRLLIFNGPLQKAPYTSWVFSAPNNLPDNNRRVLYVRDQGQKNRQLMARMPDRIPYLIQLDRRRHCTLTRLTGDEATKRAADAKIDEARLLLQQKKYREAALLLVEASKMDPGYFRSYLLLGWGFEQAGRPDMAEPAYRKAAELNPDQPEPHFFLGRFLGRQQKWKEAEEQLVIATTMDGVNKEYMTALEKIRSRTYP